MQSGHRATVPPIATWQESLLSNAFPGYVKVIHEETGWAVFYGQIEPQPLFPGDGELLPLVLPMQVRLRQAGRYTVRVWFFEKTSADVLKMEQPFDDLGPEA